MEKDTLILIIKRSDLRTAFMAASYDAVETDDILRVLEDLAVPPVQYELPLTPPKP